MAQSKSLSSDPEELLQFMDNLDSDFSDDDFEGNIDEDEWLEGTMSRRISVQQEDGSRGSVVSVHDSRERISSMWNSNGMDGDVNDDRTEESENGSQTEGSGNGGGMDGCENGSQTEGSENDGMDSDEENSSSDEDVSTNRNGLPVFSENVGVIPDMTGKEPVDYYRLFITDSLLQNVLDETNRYGEQYIQAHQDYLTTHPRARSHDFVKRRFTMSELLRLIVLMITMGIMDLPSLKDYWSTSWPFCTPHFSKLLSRDRFFLLLKFLHLADNTKQAAQGQPGYDRRIQIWADFLSYYFCSVWSFSRTVSRARNA